MALDGFQAGWASLPRNLVDCIFDCLLPNSGDIVRFSAVCTYWRSVAWENFRCRQLPFLVVPVSPKSNLDGRMSYHVSTMVGDVELSLPGNVGLYGCSCGWLILMKANEVFLMDPSSGETIRPPPLQRLCPSLIGESPLTKGGAVLSTSPDTDRDGYVLMVTYGFRRDLAFIRAGDPNWTYIDHIDCVGDWHLRTDSCLTLTYHKGLFVSLHRGNVLLCIDVKRSDFTVKKLASRYAGPPRILLLRYGFDTDACFVKHYENGKEHLWVVLRQTYGHLGTCDFEIYKLSDDDGGVGGGNDLEWTLVTNLGDLSLLLGEAPSYCFLAGGGSLPNTIFFYGEEHLHQAGSQPLNQLKNNIWSDLNHPILFVPAFL